MLKADFYDESYRRWKGWGRPAAVEPLARTFAAELRGVRLSARASVLEIGFGQGIFLDWARAQGFVPVGIELNQALVESVRRRGHEAYHGHARDVLSQGFAPFDLVVLFDVLEHLTVEEILDLLSLLKSQLSAGGAIVARFPNGGSPFGRLYQHGDLTHCSVLTASSIEQAAIRCGLKVVAARNSAREDVGNPRWRPKNWRMTRKIAFLIRSVIELIVGLVYFGRIVPLDPNLTVVLAHCPDIPCPENSRGGRPPRPESRDHTDEPCHAAGKAARTAGR